MRRGGPPQSNLQLSLAIKEKTNFIFIYHHCLPPQQAREDKFHTEYKPYSFYSTTKPSTTNFANPNMHKRAGSAPPPRTRGGNPYHYTNTNQQPTRRTPHNSKTNTTVQQPNMLPNFTWLSFNQPPKEHSPSYDDCPIPNCISYFTSLSPCQPSPNTKHASTQTHLHIHPNSILPPMDELTLLTLPPSISHLQGRY